jgi:hypothetical protein
MRGCMEAALHLMQSAPCHTVISRPLSPSLMHYLRAHKRLVASLPISLEAQPLVFALLGRRLICGQARTGL